MAVTLTGICSLLCPSHLMADVGTYYPGLDENEPDRCLPPARIDSGDDAPDEDLDTLDRCLDDTTIDGNNLICENGNEEIVPLGELCWLRSNEVFSEVIDGVTRDQCIVAEDDDAGSRAPEEDFDPTWVDSVCCAQDSSCQRLLNADDATCIRVVNAPENQDGDLGFCDTPKRLGPCRNADGTIDSAQLRRCFTREDDDGNLERTRLADGDCDRDGVPNREDCALCDPAVTARRGSEECAATTSDAPVPGSDENPLDPSQPEDVPLITSEDPGFRGGGGCTLGTGMGATGWALLLPLLARRRRRYAGTAPR